MQLWTINVLNVKLWLLQWWVRFVFGGIWRGASWWWGSWAWILWNFFKREPFEQSQKRIGKYQQVGLISSRKYWKSPNIWWVYSWSHSLFYWSPRRRLRLRLYPFGEPIDCKHWGIAPPDSDAWWEWALKSSYEPLTGVRRAKHSLCLPLVGGLHR